MDFFGYNGGLLSAAASFCITMRLTRDLGLGLSLGFYTCFDFQIDCKLLRLVVKKGSFPCSNYICVEVFLGPQLLKEAKVRLAYLFEKF